MGTEPKKANRGGGESGEDCQVIVYLDDQEQPVARYRPPAQVDLDTRQLSDGEHILRIEAEGRDGVRGTREVSFMVRNGPAIAVDGLRDGDRVEGRLSVMIHAFDGAGREDWEPARAETPTPIPTWVWFIVILIFAWAMFYTVSYWNPAGHYAEAPTWEGRAAPTE